MLKSSVGSLGFVLGKENEMPDPLLEQSLHHIRETVDDIKVAIMGNHQNLGLLIRVDRLEQSTNTKDKVIWMLVTAVVPLILHTVWKAL